MSTYLQSIASLLALSFIYIPSNVQGCAELTGIGYSPDDIYTPEDLAAFPTAPNTVTTQIIIPTFFDFGATETTPNIYYAALYSLDLFNTLGAFDDRAIDFWGRQDITLERRRCGANDTNVTESSLYNLHYKLAFAFAWYFGYATSEITPTATASLAGLLQARGVNPFICDNATQYNCSDPANIGTPWGLAYVVAVENNEFWLRNGWNADGADNRDYNRVRFDDPRGDDTKYVPVNTAFDLEDTTRWEPLTEDTNRGFLFSQQHITPHIGYTGRSIFYTDDEVCARRIYDPFYNYTEEIELVFSRLASLTDEIKMEVEFFDDKVNSLTVFSTVYSIINGLDVDKLDGNLALISESLVNYEAVIAVWKEKIDYDLIRPKSLIRYLFEDELITTYAGVNKDGKTEGTQTYFGKDFDSYFRTMPHSEYPSASACICTAYAKAKVVEFGNDNLIAPLTRTYAPFESEVEPASTPANEITFFYFTWSDIAKRCSETRYEGGMHFTESVPAGAELCGDIGTEIAAKVIGIRNGVLPDFMIDFDDREVYERDCYPNRNRCRIPKSCSSEPCSEAESGNCKEYTDGVGCTECENGFYLADYNHPCIECSESCDNCNECQDFTGCTQCQSGFELVIDDISNIQFCDPEEDDSDDSKSSDSDSGSD